MKLNPKKEKKIPLELEHEFVNLASAVATIPDSIVSRIFRHWLNVILEYSHNNGSSKQIFTWRKNKDTNHGDN